MKKNILILGMSLLLATSPIYAKPQYEYLEKKEVEKIAEGVTHEKILSFTSDGFRGINIIRLNLNSPTVELVPLYNKNTASKADTVKNMANASNVVAGVNGDFFEFKPMFPLGLTIENGEMIYSNSHSDHPTPSFLLANDGSMTIGRVEINMALRVGEKVIPISTLNKPNGYGSTGAYSRRWGQKSRGGKVNSQTEIAIKDGLVVNRVDGGDPIDIPEGGYVINIKDGLYLPEIGESCSFEISGINIDNIKFGIGAGSVILKDGVITNSHINIKGSHPRTALGINKNTGEAFLITIDGRSIYHGMDTTEVAELLQKLGCTDGFNLDGGGSTTLVIRDENSNQNVVKNHIDSERRVANGVGVRSNSTKGAPSSIKVKTEGEKLFKDTTKWISVKVYDDKGNPLAVDNSQISITTSLKSDVNGKSFTPREAGMMDLTVSYQGLSETVNLNVLDAPSVILLDKDTLSLGANGTYKIPDVVGVDAVGNRAIIRGHELNKTVIGNVGVIRDNSFVRNDKISDGAIVLSFKNAKNRIIISKKARKKSVDPIGDIKHLSVSAKPENARAALSKIIDKRPLARLWFNFEKVKDAKEAMLQFKNPPTLPEDTTELSVFAKNLNDLVLSATLLVDGKELNVDLNSNLNLNGYTEYRGKVPSTNGIKLLRLSVSETEGNRVKKGYIDVKDVAAVISPDTSTMFKEYISPFYDHLKTSDVNSNDISVVVAGEKANSSKFLENFKDYGTVSLMGKKVSNAANIQKEMIHRDGDVLFANFKNNKGGLRASDINQWNELLTTVKNTDCNTIIVTIDGASKGELGFLNPIEADLLKETLEGFVKNGKRVLLVTNLKEPTSTRYEEGVRYINLNPLDTEIHSLNINRIGETLLYSIKKVK